ncbi:hypothetical protein BTUL_0015g00710 [Botrytis tulipae]|uniref:MYND-type domain-containing protein n=1 Tax=Botrytis tulipae TaxID=87230 RepID=A0A4Z1EZS9_9HELO|nr:hypothetical protein BTUL_0015g00710 [Botrytis tulipae]
MSRKWISTFATPEASQYPPDCPQYQFESVDLTPKCAFCNVTGAKQRCAGCKTLFYCNEQCQKGDWKLHKLLEIKMPSMPTHNILQTPINKCASRLASNWMTFGHRGSMIVIHRIKGTRSIGDVQPSDLRIVADWLCRHVPPGMKDYQIKHSFQGFTNEIRILEELHHAEKSAAPKVSAVRIHCEGGTGILRFPKYESIEISTVDYAFLHEDTECTKAMGIGLILRSFNEPYDYPNLEGQHKLALRTNALVPHRNEEALFLFLTIDPEDESWGGLSPRDMVRFPLQEIGSFQVVRKDKKSITVQQVEVIANYFRHVVYFEMGNLIHRYKDGRPPTVEKEKVTKGLLNRDAFENYFRKFRKAKIEGEDQSWADAISPFDV